MLLEHTCNVFVCKSSASQERKRIFKKGKKVMQVCVCVCVCVCQRKTKDVCARARVCVCVSRMYVCMYV